jgi:hypothetical protein
MNLKLTWIIVVGGCAAGLGTGFLFGRYYPAHSFQRFGESRYLLDSTTGKICDPFKDPNANPADLSDLFGSSPPAKDANASLYNAYGKSASSYPSACGK